jgi:DNA primase
VATLGTSLTSGHIQILKGFVGKSGRAILVYDSDAAGIKAAKRSIEIFDKGYLDARILVLPSRHDPDSFLLKYGKQAFVKLVDKAQGAISFLIESSIRKHGLSTEGKIRIISDIKEQLSAIQDNVARSLYIKELAERIRVDESLVMEKIRINQNNSQGLKRPPESGESLIERRIITMMLQFPEILPEIANLNVLDYFDKSRLKSIGETLLRYSGDSGVDVSQLINIISDDETIRIVGSLAIKEEPWNLEGGIKLIQKFVQTMQARRENKPIEEQIREAEKINDEKLLLKLLGEKQKLAVLSEKRKMALASLRVNKN